ncbi:SGNH hydrolase [Piromyces finnis]|uniref:SGNH hydrolase n=1 Tax=Piromyces finnis TaxID=1754191 RepID=A0A1Y1VBW9_9FUNG|nr:SGNH hydrolase [Piromyces finnis]|eukprot:ORX52257.1 SGNH hydrolase [Piromyces finnis]
MKFSIIGIMSLGLATLANAACSNKAFYQCGGKGFKGETCCDSGYTCKTYNEWFSQCIQETSNNNGSNASSNTNNNNNINNNNNNVSSARIFIAGDSTVDNKGGGNGTVGWGKLLSNYVTIPVYNHARAGRSTRSFMREGKWDALINDVKEGDYVFIEFGHNDGGGPYQEKERGVVDGEGDNSVTVRLSSGEMEVVHTYSWYLRTFANQVRAKKANPIILTQTPRKVFQNGRIETPGRFVTYAMNVAKQLGIPCIDMYNYIARQYESLGEGYLNQNKYFPNDNVHTSEAAADLNTRILVNAFSKCEKIPGLAAVLNDKGKAVNLICAK